MTERTSERIWRAARAHYEIWERFQEYWEAGQVLSWDEVLQDRRDLEYDAMVAAFKAVPVSGLHEFAEVVHGLDEAQQRKEARIAELEAEVRRLQTDDDLPTAEDLRADVSGIFKNDCDLLGVHERRIVELEADQKKRIERARRYMNRIVELEAERDKLDAARREARAALKPFAEYAERIEKQRPGWYPVVALRAGARDLDITMSWFIAALKAYRGEGVAEPGPVLEKRPVAFRLKLASGQWTFFDADQEEGAAKCAELFGVDYQGLYVRQTGEKRE